MNQISITRRFEIDAGHRLMSHKGKCWNLHGHRYAFQLEMSAPEVDKTTGMLLDFGLIKQLVGGWLNDHWDHGMILQKGDPLAEWMVTQSSSTPVCFTNVKHGWEFSSHPKLFIMQEPPTAENLVRIFMDEARRVVNYYSGSIIAKSARCYETPSCWADYVP